MDLTLLNIGAIRTMDELNYVSSINKRDNYKQKIHAYIENKLPEAESHITWAEAGKDYDLIPQAEGRSYNDLWHERHEKNGYYFTGDKKADVLALEFVIGFERVLNFDVEAWAKTEYMFFCEEFDEDNILSGMLHIDSEKHPHIHFLVYYTNDSGALTTEPYIVNGKISKDFILKHENAMKPFGYDKESRLNAARGITKHSDNKGDAYLNTIDRYIPKNPRTSLDNQIGKYNAKESLADKASVMPVERQEEILDKVLKHFDVAEKTAITQARTGQMSKQEFAKLVKDILQRKGIEKPAEINIMQQRVESAVFGNYVLDALIDDPTISDIKVLAPDDIRVKQHGRRLTSNLHFRGYNDYMRFLEGIAIRNHTDLSPMNAVQTFTDAKSGKNAILRVNIATSYVNSVPFPYLHIRKIPKTKYTIENLIEYNMMDTKTAAYLLDKVKDASGILFTGKGASGKTTLMNTLLEEISYNNSCLVIQENEELFTTSHPDMMFQHVVTARHKGEQEYDLKDLARNGLLTDLDYFIIGEIKGGEALYFLNAADTGHKCWASCHGNSSTEAIKKLADYVMYEGRYTPEDSLKMLHTLQVVVFMKQFKVQEISEVVGWDDEKKDLIYKRIL